MNLDIHKILQYIPHRYPFLLIDRVEALDPGKSITVLKNVTYNEPYFAGHFPEMPVMPGVLILEAMAQAAGMLAFVTHNVKSPGKVLYFFAGIDNARFKQVVSPGDQLRLHMVLERERQDVWKFHGKAMVGDKLACEADLIIAGRKDK
ncbi:MAG TPA: 3-hydroxyacyl-ACP dehydratase FabZ [Gammaproteobacteria bacterium]|nr:3-hydroxyacyl-ACP dehydratase FabZ [Gammaproteobacteria bacterium]